MVDEEKAHPADDAWLDDPLKRYHEHPPLHLHREIGVLQKVTQGCLSPHPLLEYEGGASIRSRQVIARR